MRLKINSIPDLVLKSCWRWYQEIMLLRRLRSDYLRINGLSNKTLDLLEKGENILLLELMKETGER